MDWIPFFVFFTQLSGLSAEESQLASLSAIEILCDARESANLPLE